MTDHMTLSAEGELMDSRLCGNFNPLFILLQRFDPMPIGLEDANYNHLDSRLRGNDGDYHATIS